MRKYIIRTQTGKATEVQGRLSPLGIKPTGGAGDFIFVDIPEARVSEVQALPGVVRVTPDQRVGIAATMPVDAKVTEFSRLFKQPFGLPRAIAWSRAQDAGRQKIPTSLAAVAMGADRAWALGIKGQGVKVCVLDTGMDIVCPQLPGIMAKSYVSGDPVGDDQNGHSTHVTTTIAGRQRGPLIGLASGVDILPIKVLGYGIGMGNTSDILKGMQAAADWGADVVSMSLGGEASMPPEDDPMCIMIKEHTARGTIYSVAAGNSGPKAQTIGSPGISPEAITVAAVDINGKIADFSSRGPAYNQTKPDVAGIGVNLESSTTGLIGLMQFQDSMGDIPGKRGAISGTSMATPCCSAVIALALGYARERGKTLTAWQVKEAMASYGDFAGASKRTDYGWGLLTFPILERYIDSVA